jgi:septum site-determining protein MinD
MAKKQNPKVFSIVALKGGVGKTTVTSNLGAALADQFGKRVLVVDANFTTPHLGLHVGLVNTDNHLHSVLEGHTDIRDTIHAHPIGFDVIPGKLSPYQVNYRILKEKLDPLRDEYDIILIDSSPSLNDEMLAVMEASDEIIVVSSPDYPTLSSTLHAINVAQEQGTPIRGLIINKVRGKNFELSSRDIKNASEAKVIESLPEDEKVLAALSRMIPVVYDSPKREISHKFKKVAGSMVGEKYSKGVWGVGGTKKKKKK